MAGFFDGIGNFIGLLLNAGQQQNTKNQNPAREAFSVGPSPARNIGNIRSSIVPQPTSSGQEVFQQKPVSFASGLNSLVTTAGRGNPIGALGTLSDLGNAYSSINAMNQWAADNEADKSLLASIPEDDPQYNEVLTRMQEREKNKPKAYIPSWMGGGGEQAESDSGTETKLDTSFDTSGNTEGGGSASNSKKYSGKSTDELYGLYSAENGISDYDSFADFQTAGDNSDAWLDFMKWSYDNAGAYENMLADDVLGSGFFDYDPADEAVMAEKRAAYSDWFNPWVNEHTVDDLYDQESLEDAAMILGSYGQDYNALTDWLERYNWGMTRKDVGEGFYQPVLDENGNLAWSNPDKILQNDDEDYWNTTRDMLINKGLQANLSGYGGLSLDQLDMLNTMYGDEAIDFGLADTRIPGMVDKRYGSAGAASLSPEVLQLIPTMDFSDYAHYQDNPNFARQSQAAMAYLLGAGSSLADETWSPQEWDYFNKMLEGSLASSGEKKE